MGSEEADVDAAREAFSLLGHELRLEILLALLEGWEAIYTEPVGYAELMAAVGAADSGRFNYHLRQLLGVYVDKVEGGYVPTASAGALYRAVLAHRPTGAAEIHPGAIESDCPVCESSLSIEYERGFVSVGCGACEEWPGLTYPFPRNGFDGRDGEAVLAALSERVHHHVGLAASGQCPGCAGSTTADLRLEDAGSDAHYVEITCGTCSFVVGIDPLSAAVHDERVASALREAGIDIQDRDGPETTTRIESHDPPLLALEVDGVTIVLDEALAVHEIRSE